MLRAYLSVESVSLTPEHVSEATGLIPDGVRMIGDRVRPGSNHIAEWNSWKKDIHNPPGQHFGTQGLSQELVRLGGEVADAFRAFRDAGADVALVLWQEVRGDLDAESKGLAWEHEAIEWMARAGVSLVVDQYLYTEDEDGRG